MKNSEVFDLMMARLAGRTADTTRAFLVLELNQKKYQLEIAPQKPWWLEKETSGTMDTTLFYNTLPAGFVEEYEDGAVRIANMDNVWQDDPKKVNIEVLERETNNADGQLPEGYSIYNNKIYWGPKPDQAYPYKVKYYGHTTDVADDSNDVTNEWLLYAFNFITLSTLHFFALTHLQGTELANKLKPELLIAQDQFMRAVESRKHANMDYLLGDTEN